MKETKYFVINKTNEGFGIPTYNLYVPSKGSAEVSLDIGRILMKQLEVRMIDYNDGEVVRDILLSEFLENVAKNKHTTVVVEEEQPKKDAKKKSQK